MEMKGKKNSARSRYMSGEDFAELHQSFTEALQFVRGERADLRTMQRFLPPAPEPMAAQDIAALRHSLNLSQALFARLLNVSKKTIEAWEYGTRKPGDAALKLLRIAERHPEILTE
jgi:putative transcriptional regulator